MCSFHAEYLDELLILCLMLQFSHLIDENTGSKFDMIGSNAVSNKDNARKSSFSLQCALSNSFATLMLNDVGLMSWRHVF